MAAALALAPAASNKTITIAIIIRRPFQKFISPLQRSSNSNSNSNYSYSNEEMRAKRFHIQQVAQVKHRGCSGSLT